MQRLVLQRGFGVFAAGDVAVDAEHRPRVAVRVDLERPAAGHHHRRAIMAGVDQLAFPAAGADELGVYLSQRQREPGLQDRLGRTTEHVGLLPAIQLFSTAVPEANRPGVQVPDKNGVVCQIEELGLLGQRGRLLLHFAQTRGQAPVRPIQQCRRPGQGDGDHDQERR